MNLAGKSGGKRLLLHVCCAPCATAPIEKLRDEYKIIAFFYNPNIFPPEEYERRLVEARRFCRQIDIPLIEGFRDQELWEERTVGLQDEPEGGRRCHNCIELRLETAARYAREHGFDAICTTLSVSPHKSALMISEIGAEQEGRTGVEFLAVDFKKEDGFRRSIELSREYSLYRQDYCGCAPSLRERDLRHARKGKKQAVD